MIKKLVAVVACAALAVVALPAASAEAKSNPGASVGCYTVKKKGNYNDVRLGVTSVSASGHRVAAYGNEMVTASCQKVNSIPVVNMHIYWALVSVNGVHKAISGLAGNGNTRPAIHVQSPFTTVPCGASVVIWERVSYSYYDHTQVRPFVIHGPAFRVC